MNAATLKQFLYICELAVLAKAKGHDVFVTLSPHVSSINIALHLDGWKENAEPYYLLWYWDSGDCYRGCDSPIQFSEIISALENLALS